MTPLLVATTNRHKTKEIAAILGPVAPEWHVEDLSAYPSIPPVPETGATFEENAAIKAVAASHRLRGQLVLADDSGIEVDALGGRPGILSARFAGENASDAENRAKLLSELSEVTDPAGRSARFCCAMVLAKDGAVISSVRGEAEGTVSLQERGAGGFGYDPIFVPEGYDETFAELSSDIKNKISHRARALAEISNSLGCIQT